MKLAIIRPSKNWLKRHWIILMIIPVLVVGTASYVWFMVTEGNAAHTKQQLAMRADLDKLDQEIEAIKARKAEEERLRKEAEAKATAEQVINTPEENAGAINSASCNVSGTRNNPASVEVLVNKKHCIQPLTFSPSNLVTVYGATLVAPAAEQFKLMYEAAAAAGLPISSTSSYRSYSSQVATYNYWVNTSGQAGADTYSARPGYSEHQTGLAVDVAAGGCALDCFGSTPQYAWLQENAATYGFIQRYYVGYDSITGYKAEEWHYRYVGPAIAQDMKAKGIKTLEQYWNLPGGTY